MREVFNRARRLRASPTDAERRLWQALRGKQVEGLRFRRQFPIAGFIADFACPEVKLVVEVDGGQHAERIEQDEARTKKIAVNGYRVLRFWNHEVLQRFDDVLEAIRREALTPPQPSPASRGGSEEPEPTP